MRVVHFAQSAQEMRLLSQKRVEDTGMISLYSTCDKNVAVIVVCKAVQGQYAEAEVLACATKQNLAQKSEVVVINGGCVVA